MHVLFMAFFFFFPLSFSFLNEVYVHSRAEQELHIYAYIFRGHELNQIFLMKKVVQLLYFFLLVVSLLSF